MSRIHKIAVFISHIYGEYQRNLCQGVIDKATEFGYYVDIFVSNDENILGQYARGESSIIKIPHPSTYDGVILSSDTYLVSELRDNVISTLQRWNCPIVDVNSVQSPFPKVLLDNNAPIEDLVAHLTTVHSLQNIYYLGSTVEKEISGCRESHYTHAMLQLKLSSHIFVTNADLSASGISSAIDTLLAADVQAIVCYNDIMACMVIGELASRGISVPEQIAVTGCDNLEFGQNISPSLTTVTFPSYELGEQGFLMLLALLDHTAPTQPPMVKASTRYGGSCGCTIRNEEPPILFSNKLKAKIDTLESTYLKDIRMSASLQGLTNIDAAMDLLFEFLRNIQTEQGIEGLTECYLCLYSDWEQISNRIRRLTLMDVSPEKDKVLLKLAIRNHVRLPECTFSRSDSLPEFLRKNGSQVYVFTPLYFGDLSFGYLCQAFEKNLISYPFSFVSCLQNIDNMLQTISDNRNMQLMLDRLEEIYSHDELTGLLNLQSFNMLLPNFIKRAAERNSGLITIVLDLDHLKQINDIHGHAEGNFAIQALGQAISQVCTDDLLACRFGGDEFYMVGTGLSSDEAQQVISRIQQYLEHYNDNNIKPYQISVSGGHSAASFYTEDSLNEAFRTADRNMYKQKQLRHQTRK